MVEPASAGIDFQYPQPHARVLRERIIADALQDVPSDAAALMVWGDLDQSDVKVIVVVFDVEASDIDTVDNDDLCGLHVKCALQIRPLFGVIPPHTRST